MKKGDNIAFWLISMVLAFAMVYLLTVSCTSSITFIKGQGSEHYIRTAGEPADITIPLGNKTKLRHIDSAGTGTSY